MARTLLEQGAPFTVPETDLEFDMPPDPDVVYTLRPITVDYARVVYKRHTTQGKFNRRTGQREEVVNHLAARDELFDYCLVSWTGILAHGQPAPCDLAHKMKLPGVVQAALVDRAQQGQRTPEDTAESFRQPAGVLPVLGG